MPGDFASGWLMTSEKARMVPNIAGTLGAGAGTRGRFPLSGRRVTFQLRADSRRRVAQQQIHTPLYIETPDAADRFLATLGAVRAVAVDTEGASFHRFVDRIYLLQLSTAAVSAVLDPLSISAPAALGALLEDPGVEVVFHDADYDLRLLHQDYGWHVTNIFDTRIAAQLAGLRTFGLAALLERYFDIKLDKRHQRADWSMRPLTRDMLSYASQDTQYLLPLRDRLREELARLGREEWAKEEFSRLEGTRWADDSVDGNGYLRTKGARDLSRRELAIFRELSEWRDRVAAELDRATFRVASSEALFAVARRAPPSLEELAAVKGMPRGIVERRGGEVLEAVRRGLAVSDDQLPRVPRAPKWARDADYESRVTRLRRVRDAAAQRLDLDPGFLCSRDRLEAVARRNPRSLEELAEIPELRRWQVEVLGEEFLMAVRGVGNGE
ncbi:MAG: ribonuclease D [Gemmatimonadaceae bacterium]